MFTPEEMETHLARIERRHREPDTAAMEDDVLTFEDPEAVAQQVRQFGLVKELLTATALGM